jgi:probable rRNA maturation factor
MTGTPKRKPARTPDLALTVQYGTRGAQLPSPAKFRRWIRAALRTTARVTLRVVNEPEGRKLNLEYRGRDYATNVLTFVYSKNKPLDGDIAICAPVVAREARLQGMPREAHYAHLAVHGMLHLQGFDHAREPAAKRMENLEIRILAGLGFANPYQGAASRSSRKPVTAAARAKPRASGPPI